MAPDGTFIKVGKQTFRDFNKNGRLDIMERESTSEAARTSLSYNPSL